MFCTLSAAIATLCMHELNEATHKTKDYNKDFCWRQAKWVASADIRERFLMIGREAQLLVCFCTKIVVSEFIAGWQRKRFCRTLGINIKIHSLSAFISFSAPFSFHCSYVFSWVWLPKINFIHSFWNVWTFLLTATGPMQSEVRLIFFWNLVIILSHFFPLLCFVFNVLMGSLVLQMKGSYFLQK